MNDIKAKSEIQLNKEAIPYRYPIKPNLNRMISRLFISGILGRHSAYILLGIVILLSSVTFLRVWFVGDIIWDDNFWAEAMYECQNNYDCFYKAGFLEMARPLLAPYFYWLFWLYRNTDYFYIFWHGIDTLTFLGSPLLLYLFLRNLFPEKQELAFFSATAYVIFHLDQTLAYAAATNYRIGLLLTILSLFLTERAFQQNKVRAGYLAAAAICAVVSYSVFIEATLTLELARGLAIAYLLRSRLMWARPVWRYTLRYWYLFVLLTFPIIAYKLLNKPEGFYAHMYGIDPLFFLKWRETLVAAAHYLQFSWVVMLHYLDEVTVTSWVLGLSAVGGSYFLLYKSERLPVFAKLRNELEHHPTLRVLKSSWQSDREFLLLGAAAFLPPTLFFQVVSRPPITIQQTFSSHATISQIGYGMLAGWLLAVLYKASVLRNQRDPWMKYLVAVIFGMGVFFNNATIDQYLKSWELQNRFWTAFTQRFASIPDGKHFIFDTAATKFSLYSDVNNILSLEFQLNLLYATSTNPSPFRRVTANTGEAWGKFATVNIYNMLQKERTKEGTSANKLLDSNSLEIMRGTYFGTDTIRPKDFIFVHYRDGILLVNDEITKKFPEVANKDWINIPFPELPSPPPSYPLRYKMRGPGAGF